MTTPDTLAAFLRRHQLRPLPLAPDPAAVRACLAIVLGDPGACQTVRLVAATRGQSFGVVARELAARMAVAGVQR